MTAYSDFPIAGAVVADGEHDGIIWVAARAPIYDAVNGYVRLPDGHPWLDTNDLWKIENSVPWGEVTFGRGNWRGFDTTHYGQYWPSMSEPPLNLPHDPGALLMSEDLAIEWTQQFARDAAKAKAVSDG